MFVNLYDELRALAAQQEEETCCIKCGSPISRAALYGCLQQECPVYEGLKQGGSLWTDN